MKFTSASLLAMGFALSVASAPLALAQSDQHDQNSAAAPAQHTETHATAPAPHVVVRVVPTPQHAPVQAQYDQQHRPVVQASRPVEQARGPQRWNNGGHYGGSRVVFVNWGLYQLQQPTYGYEWVQDGDELVLIDIDTGIIANVFIIPG